jgi:hypothetical protein
MVRIFIFYLLLSHLSYSPYVNKPPLNDNDNGLCYTINQENASIDDRQAAIFHDTAARKFDGQLFAPNSTPSS